jgi:hypothetical protein
MEADETKRPRHDKRLDTHVSIKQNRQNPRTTLKSLNFKKANNPRQKERRSVNKKEGKKKALNGGGIEPHPI